MVCFISPLKQPQPCRILHKHRAQSELSRAIQTWNRKVEAGAEYLLLDSGAQLNACPIEYPGHTASGARLRHDGGRLVTYKLPGGRTI